MTVACLGREFGLVFEEGLGAGVQWMDVRMVRKDRVWVGFWRGRGGREQWVALLQETGRISGC